METAELLKKVRRIELKIKSLSKNIFSGEYHSAFKGRGMSFSEVRSYQYGDDVRNIDWNVTARANEPFVKIFEEERELTLMVLVDVSGSSSFGSKNQRKSEVFTEICAMLAFSASQNNDKVGVILFSDKIEKFIPPKKGKQHILRIIRELLDFTPDNAGTNIGFALQYLTNILKKKAICFVLSDFQADNYETALKIASKKHDIIGFRVADPLEAELPDVGLLRVRDPETGETGWIDTHDREAMRTYKLKFQQNKDAFYRHFKKSKTGVIDMGIEESYVLALLQFFKKRAS
ncbi:MAG: hypothetical protein RLZZ417_2504 [Bacteroidota bacterium]|jgi:uncharacterized protein (DUF58 family)